MLSIDEAIAHAREVAEMHRNDIVPKENYHNMPWIDKNNEVSMRSAEEHEQLAEWLEELKALREEKSDFLIFAKDIAEGNYEMGMEIGYKKAIDDAKSVILQTLDNEILVDTLHLRLEQLKEQEK